MSERPAIPDEPRGVHTTRVPNAAPASVVGAPPPAADHHTLAPGTVLEGRYRIVQLIGRGGMGEVYRADDLTLGAPVALKFLPPSIQHSRRRLDLFRAEVRMARRVSHPNVCRVHDIGQANGRVFLSMELVEGDDLASLLRRIGRLPYEKAMEIARQLCAALAALHDQGLVHRDLKPANVLLDGKGRAKLADFGLAVAADQSLDAEIAGTPMYMSPEQIRGRTATARSDIYSLGLVLYELFSGVRAHDADKLEELTRLIESDSKLRPLSEFLDRPARELDEAIARCLESDPINRPASAFGVLAMLPGGDPLRAVMEAEQTPSPELVAAAGQRVQLSRRAAVLLLVGALSCVPIEVLIKQLHSVHHAVPLALSPEVLVDRARTILRWLGHDAPVRDHYAIPAFRATTARAVLEHATPGVELGQRGPDARMRELLASRHPATFRTLYIESPTFISEPDKISAFDLAPLSDPRSVAISITHAGDLLWLRAAAPRRISSATPAPAVSDRELLQRAGLDPASFAPGTPDFVLPGVASDERSAWLGSYPGLPDFPVRVEIARFQGRVVSFECLRDTPLRVAREAAPLFSDVGAMSLAQNAYGTTFLVVILGGLGLAYRQWRAGRGDLRGARRLAGVVFGLTMLRWLLATHHVGSVWHELEPFQRALGTAAQHALIAFALYLAGEPIIRRHAPGLLVSWMRLLAGRWRDVAVGRDVLIGMSFATLYKLSELAFKTDWSDPFRLGSGDRSGVPGARMASAAHAVGVTATDIVEAIVNACLTMLTAVVVIRVCRWKPLGVALATCLLVLSARMQFGYGVGISANLAAISFGVLAMLAALRFGLLALVASFAAALILNGSPTTLDPSDWYFPSFAADVVVLAGVAILAFRWASGPGARAPSTSV